MLVVESGSTKTEWRLYKKGQIPASFHSSGINPTVQTSQEIVDNLSSVLTNYIGKNKPEKIHFYGAGTGQISERQALKELFENLFTTSTVFIETDLIAAIRCTNRSEGIVCILGTGSNSCYHKNYQLISRKGGYGYLIGDEGSGSDLGRHLIRGVLNGEFSGKVKKQLEDYAEMKSKDLIVALHNAKKPNVQLARFAKLAFELLVFPEIRFMVKQRFEAYFSSTVLKYNQFDKHFVDFVGSVAYHFQEIILEICEEKDIKCGKIIKKPIDSLVTFHLNHVNI